MRFNAQRLALVFFVVCALMLAPASSSRQTTFRVLAFYTDRGEPDHIDFAKQALAFYSGLAKKERFTFEATIHWDDLNPGKLKGVKLMIWLNDFPKTPEQRAAFEQYMRHGGRWLGFHVSAYNDADTHWPWFLDFLGGGVF